ncbi:MAG: hypothetical protein ABWY06_07895 [Pseudomonas sp.]|uniref:hypothetical protein n=1 Tax=Pseudomonas sp. TaxID=306 RepID=UPI0033915D52
MLSIALRYWLLALWLCCGALWADDSGSYREPVLGTRLDWAKLPVLTGELYGEPPGVERRVLASVPIGRHQLLYTWSLLPIVSDAKEPVVAGFETNAGALVKRVGQHNLSLGGPAEFLSEDYPELDPQMLRQLLRNYVANLVTYFGSPAALRQALLEDASCAQADPMALLELQHIGIGDACQAP